MNDFLKKWRQGGNIAKNIMSYITPYVVPEMTTKSIDVIIGKLFDINEVVSAPKDQYEFDGYTCMSVNDCVCHGIPSDQKLAHGDLVSVDISFKYQDIFIDCCRTFFVLDPLKSLNPVDVELMKLCANVAYLTDLTIRKANIALSQGKKLDYNFFGSVFEPMALQFGYETLEEYGGHRIGEKLHLSPMIPSVASNKQTMLVEELHAFCFEPVVSHKSHSSRRMQTHKKGEWEIMNSSKKKTTHHENTYLLIGNQIIQIT